MSGKNSPTKTVIKGANVFDGVKFRTGTVVFENGKIVDEENASGDSQVIDATGKYLIPGLIDCHIHSRTPDLHNKLAKHGVTTALCMGAWPAAEVQQVQEKKTGMPEILSAGPPATCAGSFHSQFPGLSDYLIANHEEAPAWVASRISEGSSFIKILADTPGPDQATLNAVAAAAKEHGKLCIAHAGMGAFNMAIDSKADIITHVPMDTPLDNNAISRVLQNEQVSVPTLCIEEQVPRVMGMGMKYEPAKESVQRLYDAGVPVLVGTDANEDPGSPCPVPHGESMHHEMELLVDAGLTPLDVLRGAIELAAKYFKLGNRGVIASGMRADLVLLTENPIEDIKNSRKIEDVWIEGIKYSGAK